MKILAPKMYVACSKLSVWLKNLKKKHIYHLIIFTHISFTIFYINSTIGNSCHQIVTVLIKPYAVKSHKNLFVYVKCLYYDLVIYTCYATTFSVCSTKIHLIWNFDYYSVVQCGLQILFHIFTWFSKLTCRWT